jgi:hypothetical protein
MEKYILVSDDLLGSFLLILHLLLPETIRPIVSNGARTPSPLLARYTLVFYRRTTRVRWAVPTPASEKRINTLEPLHIII